MDATINEPRDGDCFSYFSNFDQRGSKASEHNTHTYSESTYVWCSIFICIALRWALFVAGAPAILA
jgi:hypothetical protein